MNSTKGKHMFCMFCYRPSTIYGYIPYVQFDTMTYSD